LFGSALEKIFTVEAKGVHELIVSAFWFACRQTGVIKMIRMLIDLMIAPYLYLGGKVGAAIGTLVPNQTLVMKRGEEGLSACQGMDLSLYFA